ncbi:MAG: hypothetical protein JXA66_06745 [Oligoflexia bacterium]|nr:hypothetical protein [Oligoflexia bacterium]
MKAGLIFREKKLLHNLVDDQLAIAEIRIWRVPKGRHYPDGIKYSLYLVQSGKILVGFDNHFPKGHHLHIGDVQVDYVFISYKKLLDDFWKLVKERGFSI